jgi:hypothetical protein
MLELIEVQSGDYLGEDDIVRYEDVYGRGVSFLLPPAKAGGGWEGVFFRLNRTKSQPPPPALPFKRRGRGKIKAAKTPTTRRPSLR